MDRPTLTDEDLARAAQVLSVWYWVRRGLYVAGTILVASLAGCPLYLSWMARELEPPARVVYAIGTQSNGDADFWYTIDPRGCLVGQSETEPSLPDGWRAVPAREVD